MGDLLTQQSKLTRADYKRRAAEIIRQLESEVSAWRGEDATPEAKRARMEKARHDPFYFGKTYLPHYFSDPPAPFHHELVELITVRGGGVVPVVVAAPRGFAKSTVVSFNYVLHQAIFKQRHFVILGSDTADLASDLSGYLHLELLHNQRIIADFGEQTTASAAVDDFVTTSGTRILARGRGQRIRGLKHHQHRPDLVVLDDLENDQNVKNPKIVKALLKWILEAVYPAIDEDNGSLFIIGTILSKRSALAIMRKGVEEPYNTWVARLYKALNTDERGDLYSLWPTRHPVEKLLLQKSTMGTLAFNKEKQNDPRDEEGSFREEWVTRHAFKLSDVPPLATTAGFYDPSMSTAESADYKAIVVVVQHPDGWLGVVDAYVRRESLEQALLMAFALHKKHTFTRFGCEDNLFQKLLLKDFNRLRKERGHMPVSGVTHTTNKEARVNGLSSLVENGLLRFPVAADQSEDMKRLIEQLIFFPDYPHDDGPDALEGAVALLAYGGAPNVW